MTVCVPEYQFSDGNGCPKARGVVSFICRPHCLSLFHPTEEFLSSLNDYEIAFPVRVDQNGDFLTFSMKGQGMRRSRRSPVSQPFEPPEQQVFYKVSAHQTQFLLNLTLHDNLLAKHFQVEYWKRGGIDHQHDFHEDCHYTGHLQGGHFLSSKVAISNCNGLVSTPQ